jgi:hypothetical protein
VPDKRDYRNVAELAGSSGTFTTPRKIQFGPFGGMRWDISPDRRKFVGDGHFNDRKNSYLFRDTILKLIHSDNLKYKELTAVRVA